MTENIVLLAFSVIIILLFALNFNDRWANRNYELLRNKPGAWFWFRTFNIEQTKENFIKFQRGQSIFVILVVAIIIVIGFVRQFYND